MEKKGKLNTVERGECYREKGGEAGTLESREGELGTLRRERRRNQREKVERKVEDK